MKALIVNEQDNIKITDEITEAVQSVCDEVLSLEEVEFECEVNITFVNDEEIHAINLEHRGIDRPTDVLSFPLLEFDENGEVEVYDEDMNEDRVMLGDIVISAQRAEEQAKAYGHSLLREISFLTAHSMLHLLGYDHVDDEEGEKTMIEKQNAVLDKLGITRE